jgi:uncharacterized protein
MFVFLPILMASGRAGVHVVDSVAEFRINISNLSEGIHEYTFEAEPSKIALDERFHGAIKARVELDKSARQISLQAELWAEATFECDRCLNDFVGKLDGTYTMFYIQGGRSTVDVQKEEELHILTADTNFIDLDEDVRQFILLTIPQKLLCKEDCQGLCPTCGINRNNESCTCNTLAVDSRWDELKKLSHN